MSFEGQKIEAEAKEILASLRAMQKDYEKTNDNLSVLQKHLTNAYNMMTSVFASFSSLGQKIDSTNKLGSGVKKEAKELE
jgi:DNA anti-recombination protein RmuC